MSFQAMTWAVAQKTGGAGEKLVLMMLANHCNGHTGQCNPSHRLLADECEMGLSTLKGHIAKLEARGLLRIERRFQDGVALPNQYRLSLGGVGQILAGVGQELADGRSDSGRGVGQILATNQELKPVSEPGKEPEAPKPPRGASLRASQSLKAWLESLKVNGQKPIEADDPIFAYAESAGIPDEFLTLAWAEFKRRFFDDASKKQKDWRRTFRNYVQGNYLKLWWHDGTGYRLTTAGVQAQRITERMAA